MKRTALSTAILLATTPVIAETPDTDSEAHTLDVVQVTAARVAQTVDEALSSVTVIDREEIERLQPQQFTDLLEGRAGIETSQNSAFGKTTSVYTRGTSSDHTLLLIDGVRMGSATSGGASWQFLPPEEIERVEVVRGPRTSIYGSDAIGGVVQVFTREGQKGPPRVNAFVGGGSFNTWETGVGVAGGTENTNYSFSLSHFETDGINVQDDVGDDDRDGYDNTSLATKVTHRLDNGAEVFGNVLYSEGSTEFDTDSQFSPDAADFVHAALRAGLRIPVTRQWETELSVGHSRDESENFLDGEFFSQFDTRRDMLDWRNDIDIGDRVFLTTGIDAYEDRVESDTDYDEDSRHNVGAYSVVQVDLGRHDLEGSLRYDDNEQFGNETTGQVAWGMQATEAVRLRASYGTAFKAPTFNDLYFPGFGNSDLEPETSRTFELGARYSSGPYYADAAVFRTELDQMISYDPIAFQAENIDEARIHGVELEGGYATARWVSRASLTLLDAEDRETGNELQRRSPVTARVDLDRKFQRFSMGGSVIAKSRSYNDANNDERLSGYGLLNLRASYQIAPEWQIQVTVNNVFDKDYETARGYNQPGRAAFVKLRYQQR
ncbi:MULTISPECIES: TonB-dependent receptor domain-containing protein [unclassified Thioalkalivibrio]|uniref:TonB-dependent receptor domain-containing protein n=1 Tax=unclassified Thioalkalivibrio TaxID=2621013 RepID=UPI00036FF8DD|nr:MULTISPECIES: TonB-dependent receptor [unclassified Thioalkalivibrio]